MAVAAYATDLSDITTAETTTGWSALGGGASGLNDETDYYIQGTQCVSKNGFTATEKGHIFSNGATTITAGDAVFIWIKQNNRNLMDTIANGGCQVVMGSGTNAYDQFYVDGNDSEGSALAGWRTYAVDPTDTPSASVGNSGAYTYFGAQWVIGGTGSLKGAPNGVDVIRHGRELQCTAGEAAAYATFDGAATWDSDTTRAWGLLTPTAGGYQFHGCFVMGTTATAVDFRDSDRSIVILDDPFLPTGFNEFEVRNASSNVEWTNIIITALGTTSRGILTMNVGTVDLQKCQFTGIDTSIFSATGTAQECVWTGANAITAPGTDMVGSAIVDSTVAANSSSLIWDVATDPDGLLDDMNFDSTNSTNAIHAIEFGTNVPAAMTLRGCNFSGFSASNTQNDSTFHFKDTSGTIILNIVNCTGNVTYRSDGATISIVQDPAQTTVQCVESDGSHVAGARVLLETADGTGPFAYQESVSITHTASTATVTHTAHGLDTNQYVAIRGATDELYNGVKQITVTDANTYTYSLTGSPVSPAAGSPVSSAVLVYGVSDAMGKVTDSRTYSSDQPVTGWARRTTSSPLYKEAPLSGTIDSINGGNFTAVMISDE